MKVIRFYILLLFCIGSFSCKHRVYREVSGSMKNTLGVNQTFFVSIPDEFKRGDIAVFNYYGPDYLHPLEEPGQYNLHWEKRIYRLIALSGDVIQIKGGDIFVNDRPVSFPASGKLYYEIRSTTPIDDFNNDPDNERIPPTKNGDTLVYFSALTAAQAQDYRQRKPAIINVSRHLMGNDMTTPDTLFARPSDDLPWNMDNYGPLRIPSPGDNITVNAGNYKLYKNIPGIHLGNYTIKEKLYFLLGDNFYNAEDSRYIGLIDHSNMYGIVKIK